MAENYEPYHVPHQSRRDMLRVVSHNPDFHHQPLFPIYDASLLSSSDLLAYTTRNNNPICVIKEEGNNLMGFPSSSSSPSTTRNHHHNNNPYNLDPSSALPMNPTCSIQDISSSHNNPLFYSLQTLRDFDHPYGNSDQVGILKPDQALALSLSLSSHHTHQNQSNHSLENLQRYTSAITAAGGYMVPASVVGGGGGSTSNEVSRSTVPLGPFTGYATVLKGSRFLKPAQQLLEEFCDVDGRGVFSQKMGVDASIMDPPIECFNATSGSSDDPLSSGDGSESRRKKSRLISLLDEVYTRYKQYYQQMQAVVASFECVSGLGNAAPYANIALKTMSKHFRSLKNSITDQLQFANKAQGALSHGKEEAIRFVNTDRGVYSPRPGQNSGFAEQQPVWRPQRGLPERAVTVLRAWLFEHFLHPYPTDTDKLMLAKQTGLSRSQVSNWFINARVRLWKPMVEEIHMLETKQGQKSGVVQRDERTANRLISDHIPASDNPSTSAQRVQEVPSKRSRSELPDLPLASQQQQQPLNMSYSSLSGHPHIGVGGAANMGNAGSSGGVSLTLGLHQNNGMGLSDTFPMNAPQRFGVGLETTNEGYVMGAFQTQNRHFGRDVIGGQLLHDFVG